MIGERTIVGFGKKKKDYLGSKREYNEANQLAVTCKEMAAERTNQSEVIH
jgi:hypothetical protein